MGAQISQDYESKGEVVVVGLLKGAFMFIADLVRALRIPHQIDFMAISSYSGVSSSGNVRLEKDMKIDPHGKHIIIAEDLIDTGTTLGWLAQHLKSKNCASVRIACLLDKKTDARLQDSVVVDYVGFECPDEFVIGYGMDCEELYRGLPYVAVLHPSAYPKK